MNKHFRLKPKTKSKIAAKTNTDSVSGIVLLEIALKRLKRYTALYCQLDIKTSKGRNISTIQLEA